MREYDDFAARSILGHRATQEDHFGCLHRHGPGPPVLVAVLADGMGGHACGELASRTACEQLLREIDTTRDTCREGLLRAAKSANDEIGRLAVRFPECAGMGTTLVAACFREDKITWVSVGDSHLYLFRNEDLTKLNEDHSLAPVLDRLVMTGALTEVEALTHPDRHALRSVLTGNELELIDSPSTPLQLRADDLVLLASDGINALNENELTAVISDHRHKAAMDIADILLDRVERTGTVGLDNTTAMIIKVPGARRTFVTDLGPIMRQYRFHNRPATG